MLQRSDLRSAMTRSFTAVKKYFLSINNRQQHNSIEGGRKPPFQNHHYSLTISLKFLQLPTLHAFFEWLGDEGESKSANNGVKKVGKSCIL